MGLLSLEWLQYFARLKYKGEVLIGVFGVGTFARKRVAVAGLINTASINTFREIRDTKKLAIFAALQSIFPFFFRALRALFETLLFNKL